MTRKYVRKKPRPAMSRRQFLESAVARFWSKVDRKGPDDCWLWTGNLQAPNPSGLRYGAFAVYTGNKRGYTYRAHRLAYLLAKGEIHEGNVVRHTCDVQICCNPAHLLSGTQLDNIQDQIDRGRLSIGERNSHAKLTAADVMLIRRSDESDKNLARRFGVYPSTIYSARVGRKWKHLPGARPPYRLATQATGNENG